MQFLARWFGMTLIVLGIGVSVGLTIQEAMHSAETAQAQEEMAERLTVPTTNSSPSTTQLVVEDDADDPTLYFPEGVTAVELIPPQNPTPPTLPPPPLGEPLGILTFPTLDTEWVVVEGVGVEELKLGPGHAPWTPLPGTEGNATISGHRTTYGAPFHDLHLLEEGDAIIFEDTTYTVTETLIVTPEDVWVTEDRGEGKHLTLTTCHPIGSARERLIIFAEVIDA